LLLLLLHLLLLLPQFFLLPTSSFSSASSPTYFSSFCSLPPYFSFSGVSGLASFSAYTILCAIQRKDYSDSYLWQCASYFNKTHLYLQFGGYHVAQLECPYIACDPDTHHALLAVSHRSSCYLVARKFGPRWRVLSARQSSYDQFSMGPCEAALLFAMAKEHAASAVPDASQR
jgi:hypothetical protein